MFIYVFLNSKTIIGFVGNNLKQDTLYTPDIIVYRKGWNKFYEIFADYFTKAKYQKIIFPVKDNAVNNIPELIYPNKILNHQFKSLISIDEKENMTIYCKLN
jgi:hypothetical protein